MVDQNHFFYIKLRSLYKHYILFLYQIFHINHKGNQKLKAIYHIIQWGQKLEIEVQVWNIFFFNSSTLNFMLGCRSKHSQIKRTRPGCVGSGEDPHKITSSRWNYAISLQVSIRQCTGLLLSCLFRPFTLPTVLPHLEFDQTWEFMTYTSTRSFLITR